MAASAGKTRAAWEVKMKRAAMEAGSSTSAGR
jgi:hypothetical protein